MAYETFEKVEGLIRNIDRSDDCCSMILALSGDGEVTNVVVSGDTAVIDHVRLRPGMRVAAFYDTNLPTPAVYPPQVPGGACGASAKRPAGDAGLFQRSDGIGRRVPEAEHRADDKCNDSERAAVYMQSGKHGTARILHGGHIQHAGADHAPAGDRHVRILSGAAFCI